MTRSILIVDDESVVRSYLERALRIMGYEVAEASDGESAWQLALERSFDLVITDNRMPGMGGKELARRMRERFPDTRILYVSGSQDPPASHENRVSYLSKPFGLDQLLLQVQALLADGGTAAHE
jgi:two-component system, cell cycle sensor histidine kinase and response regulator CckA